jgi:hypothetical protein
VRRWQFRAFTGSLACCVGVSIVGCAGNVARHLRVETRDAVLRVERGRLLASDDFRGGLSAWVIEQQPGGGVAARDGRLEIADKGGCTVWWRARLTAPLIISYEATLASSARVSDLNSFWMASDPARPDLFAAGHGRDGRFAAYDNLLTYYVGYGGNDNTTTRFRRYAGDGTRPLRPEHDLSAPRFLLTAERPYRIELVVCGERVQYIRDGEIIFAVRDPGPLRSGWFGIRTVDSRITIRDFRISEARCPRP